MSASQSCWHCWSLIGLPVAPKKGKWKLNAPLIFHVTQFRIILYNLLPLLWLSGIHSAANLICPALHVHYTTWADCHLIQLQWLRGFHSLVEMTVSLEKWPSVPAQQCYQVIRLKLTDGAAQSPPFSSLLPSPRAPHASPQLSTVTGKRVERPSIHISDIWQNKETT